MHVEDTTSEANSSKILLFSPLSAVEPYRNHRTVNEQNKNDERHTAGGGGVNKHCDVESVFFCCLGIKKRISSSY